MTLDRNSSLVTIVLGFFILTGSQVVSRYNHLTRVEQEKTKQEQVKVGLEQERTKQLQIELEASKKRKIWERPMNAEGIEHEDE